MVFSEKYILNPNSPCSPVWLFLEYHPSEEAQLVVTLYGCGKLLQGDTFIMQN